MDKKLSNLTADLLGGYSGFFTKIIIIIIIIYGFIIIVNFLRDKFLNKETTSKDPQIIDLLSILNKLFYLAGFGFVTGNIIQMILAQFSQKNKSINFMGDWNYLTFGIILIFMGIGFNAAKKVLLDEKKE